MKFQDSSFKGLKVTLGTKSVTHARSKSNMPHQLFQSWGHNKVGIIKQSPDLTRFDVYETLCPQQMLVHKGSQIKNWSGECRDLIPTKLQCQTIQRALQSPNLQREIVRKKLNNFFTYFHQLISSSSSIS